MNAQCNNIHHDLRAVPERKGSLLPRKWSHAWSLTALSARVKQHLIAMRQRRESRDAFKHLLTLDDALLRDIGVSRADVEWAASLPFSINAASALKECAEGHKKLKDLV